MSSNKTYLDYLKDEVKRERIGTRIAIAFGRHQFRLTKKGRRFKRFVYSFFFVIFSLILLSIFMRRESILGDFPVSSFEAAFFAFAPLALLFATSLSTRIVIWLFRVEIDVLAASHYRPLLSYREFTHNTREQRTMWGEEYEVLDNAANQILSSYRKQEIMLAGRTNYDDSPRRKRIYRKRR